MGNSTNGLKKLLDEQLKLHNQQGFIEKDPISIPHRFSKKQDIEIAGFFAAIFAWGNRTTIINKCNELIQLMDDAPFQFITQHQEIELKRFLSFKHRTFNATDLLHFIRVLRYHYDNQSSAEPTLETAFINALNRKYDTVENALVSFHNYFFSLEDSPGRTKKHISTPANNSSCKRLNMFLRWMVRKDKAGVDFGIWKNIQPNQLVCPLDVHVQRVALNLNLIQSEKADWKTAVELTEKLKSFDPSDPVKYDIALFSMGVSTP
ncbi:MAG: hypothetical protein RI991_1085 [Bacteroidota bacterium]